MIVDKTAFILENTELLPVVSLPQIKLHIAGESMPIWQRSTEELEAEGIDLPYWAAAWVGGQALARYLLENREVVRDKRVLDFATGSGIAAIAAAMAGAREVVANDIDTVALKATALNAAANNVKLSMRAGDMTGSPTLDFDVILCGDVFYEKPMAKAIFGWLSASRQHADDVLIGDPGRSYLPYEQLEKLVEYELPASRPLEDSDTKQTAVWHFLPNPDET